MMLIILVKMSSSVIKDTQVSFKNPIQTMCVAIYSHGRLLDYDRYIMTILWPLDYDIRFSHSSEVGLLRCVCMQWFICAIAHVIFHSLFNLHILPN